MSVINVEQHFCLLAGVANSEVCMRNVLLSLYRPESSIGRHSLMISAHVWWKT